MAVKRRTFQRQLGERPYKKLFIISVEGKITEPQYFSMLDNYADTVAGSIIKVKCLKGTHKSSPQYVLKRMKEYLKQEKLRKSDEAWLVIDTDQWTKEQLEQLHKWSEECTNYELAVSNPKFEFWLLLHFEEGNSIGSSYECSTRLNKFLGDYAKCIDNRKFNQTIIEAAISRAKSRDNPPCKDWPRATGTTVYKLVEKILSHKKFIKE